MPHRARAFMVSGLLALFSLTCGVAVFLAFGPSAMISIPHPVVDLGRIPVGMSSKHEFRLRNSGSLPLSISHLHSDCGCVRASVDRDSVAAGDEFTLRIEAEGIRLSPRVSQQVLIFSNAQGSPHVLDVIHECVPERLSLIPPQLSFGRVEVGAGTTSRSCRIFSPDSDFKGQLKVSDSRLLAVEFAEPGRIDVRLTPQNYCGGIRESIELLDGDSLVQLPVTAFIVGPAFASPANFSIRLSDDGDYSQRFESVVTLRSGFANVEFGQCNFSAEIEGLLTAELKPIDATKTVLSLGINSSATHTLSTENHFQYVELPLTTEKGTYHLRIPVELRP